ncbi:Pyrimidine operon regulatory protein PyrR [hydrothermal vent metagenome]|uniref:Pyrimidine operon regulatory protein PyrR n=1 Tax=hydrothermal vent metagenome TaxID=652676 RepID=A0A3B0ZLF0_9ZZZZ
MPENIDAKQLINSLASKLNDRLQRDNINDAVMIGIHSGGVWVATHLHELIKLKQPLGSLNISFYRDDFTRIGMHPQVEPSSLPFTVDEQNIILVDDVLHTGRTVKAALNAIFDYGRPNSVLLVTLIDRPGHELPIQADIVGQFVDLLPQQHIKLNGPDPLKLEVLEVNDNK